MNSTVIQNIIRFVVLVLIQVLILQNVEIFPPYVHFIIYPLFIILLPFGTPAWTLLLTAFFLGLSVDVFYNSFGVHAGAAVITGFIRPFIAGILEPRGGFDAQTAPNKKSMGITWFLQFSGILMFIHLFFYFMLSSFLFSQIGVVIIQTILSFIFSMILIIIHQYLLYPRD